MAATPTDQADEEPLQERDARTGRLLLVAPQALFGFPANLLAPTRGGVWISAATGNFGAVQFDRRSDLRAVGTGFEGYQNVAASYASHHLWLLNGPPEEPQLACAMPRTERRTALAIPRSMTGGRGEFGNVVALGDSLYVGTGAGILRMGIATCHRPAAG